MFRLVGVLGFRALGLGSFTMVWLPGPGLWVLGFGLPEPLTLNPKPVFGLLWL